MNARAPRPLPPGLHDPTERCPIQQLGPWEVRVFSWNDPRHAYLAPRGLLHLQLWAPTQGTSLLVPSRLTDGCWEVWHAGETLRVCCLQHLRQQSAQRGLLQAPCPGALVPAVRRFVLAPSVGAVAKTKDGRVVQPRA